MEGVHRLMCVTIFSLPILSKLEPQSKLSMALFHAKLPRLFWSILPMTLNLMDSKPLLSSKQPYLIKIGHSLPASSPVLIIALMKQRDAKETRIKSKNATRIN